jgi:hypothetical protein
MARLIPRLLAIGKARASGSTLATPFNPGFVFGVSRASAARSPERPMAIMKLS